MLLKATTLLLGAAALAQGFVLPMRPGAALIKQPAASALKPAVLSSNARCVRAMLACIRVHVLPSYVYSHLIIEGIVH